jgi:hypothetical protein
VNVVDDNLLRDRFARLQGESDADWEDVRRRARRRPGRRVTVLLAVFFAALVATGFGLGGHLIGFFSESGKPIPLSSLSASDREVLVNSLCKRLAFSSHAGNVQTVCEDGEPTIKQIANDGHQVHWLIRYPWGLTCIASGPVGGFRTSHGRSRVGLVGCNLGAPKERLVPTPDRPITVDLSIGATRRNPKPRILRASGLAGEGVAVVGLVARNGEVVKTPVRGRAYSFGAIPTKDWIAITAFDASGKELYRKKVELPPPVVIRATPRQPGKVQAPNPPALPRGTPLQHAVSATATADVYRSGVVAFRFTSLDSTAYRILAKSNIATPTCGKVAFGRHWETIAGGSYARMGPEVRVRMDARFGGFPRPPFDFCEISGFYGRYWDDEQGTRELVEIAFTPVGRRYLDERATARDLGYFVRTRKLERIRKAVHRGERGPTAEEIARLFGSRVVALPSRGAAPPSGKLGVWTDGKSIVAKERAVNGRLLFVTVNGVFIGYNNLRNLAHVF